MRISNSTIRHIAFAVLSTVILGVTLNGCQSSGPSGSAATTQPAFTLLPPPHEKSGEQLWADNCSRCHYIRPAGEFSGAQWASIVNHMRSRADLTGEEQRKVTAFLQASN